MVAKGDLKLRVFQDPSRFGYQMQLYVVDNHLAKSVATDMTLEKIEPGQLVPESSIFPVDEESLVELGKYLIGQGLSTAPVTERERKEHEALKIKYEMQEKLLEQMREQLHTQTKTLGEISGAAKIAKDMIAKLEGR